MKKLFLSIILLVAALGAFSQVKISARVDKQVLTLDDELTLTVRVSGISGHVTPPQLPSLPAFNVYSCEESHVIINGNATLEFYCTLLPRFVGRTQIGSVRFSYQGKTYETEPISVSIYRNAPNTPAPAATPAGGTAQPSVQRADPHLPPLEASLANQSYAKRGEPFFLVAAISNKRPYVNQPFILAVRFYYSQAFAGGNYQKPVVTDMLMEDIGKSEGTQSIGGTLYRYTEQRYQLTPVSAGKVTIGAGSVNYRDVSDSPLSAFDRLLGLTPAGPEQMATSAPIAVSVRELPTAGRPESFYGAVGNRFRVSASAEPRQVQAAEAVNFQVTVQGVGNLKVSQNLRFPSLDGFKIYPAAPVSGHRLEGEGILNGYIASYVTYKAVLVPAASGIYTIPAVEWTYFDPADGAYHTLQTEPISLTVTPAAQAQNEVNFGDVKSGGPGFQALMQDIAYLKMGFGSGENVLIRLSRLAWLNGVGLLYVTSALLFALLGRNKLARKKIFLTAKNRLKKASSGQEVADIVSVYLAERLGIHTGSLPLKEIANRLEQKGVTPATVESFALFWEHLDAERFAPAGTATTAVDLPLQALNMLRLIEEETR